MNLICRFRLHNFNYDIHPAFRSTVQPEDKKLERKRGLHYENDVAATKEFSCDFSKIETDY